ncbi:hypothetical protein BC939DRAFT_453224 [Gamsiella multidivaricata]|uniref:uncharacterized protein n=1 Tax=Gamsiella multidivaricata TaxID=101098 RepID=UPI00221FE119|nr:uncharacterized protein BC939DRAFT_453224 [Gamsiella multidivaricata]KAG0368641.1 Pol I core factor CF [Gamsiella multidivaricata]KAI7822655.1 hypothetical protein BC939DRAFT_453224 [Gamsiella multidivaricata]
MAKKPPCRICRSRKWRKNSLGFYVCEFGHQLEGHQEEEGEFDAGGGNTFERKTRRPKRKRKERGHQQLSGADADYVCLQAIQLVLRKQLHTLIHDLGFPPELEHVAHEYWLLYMSGLVKYKEKWNEIPENTDTNGLGGEDVSDNDISGIDGEVEEIFFDEDLGPSGGKTFDRSLFKDKTVDRDKAPDALDQMAEYQGGHSEDSDSTSEGSDADRDEDNYDGEMSPHDADFVDDGKEISGRQSTFKKSVQYYYDPTRLSLAFTISICYLSAQHLQIPVLLADFRRWTMDGRVLYYNASDHLPADLTKRLSLAGTSLLFPKSRTLSSFYQPTNALLKLLRESLGFKSDMPNLAPLIYRFVQELMLPVEVYPCALRLFQLYLDVCTSPQTQNPFLTQVLVDNAPLRAPVHAMAAVIIVAKLFFGLDGKQRSADDRLYWMNALPQESSWIKSLDVFDSVQAQTTLPSSFGEYEELIQVNPDLYSEYSKGALRPARKPTLAHLLAVFQSTEYVQEVDQYNGDQGISPGLEAFIKHLNTDIHPPENFMDSDDLKPPPLKPGEEYVHYKPDDAAVYLGNYGRLLSYASNALSMEPSVLQEEVALMERVVLFERRAPSILVSQSRKRLWELFEPK